MERITGRALTLACILLLLHGEATAQSNGRVGRSDRILVEGVVVGTSRPEGSRDAGKSGSETSREHEARMVLYELSALSNLITEPEHYHDSLKKPDAPSGGGSHAKTSKRLITVEAETLPPHLLRLGKTAEIVLRIDGASNPVVLSLRISSSSVTFANGTQRVEVPSSGGPLNIVRIQIKARKPGPYEILYHPEDIGSRKNTAPN